MGRPRLPNAEKSGPLGGQERPDTEGVYPSKRGEKREVNFFSFR